GYPSPTAAGTSHSFTVTANDVYGNTVTDYTGSVTFSSTELKAILPANYTFTSADAGVHSFSATLKVSGIQSLTAKDTVTSNIIGSEMGITINPAAANHLAVSRFPSKTIAGVAQNFRVTAQDQYGNTATSYTGTVTFSSSDSQAVFPTDYTFTATDAGIHMFSATLKTAGSQSLTAKDMVNAGVISSTQSGITVNPAATTQL